MCKWWRDDADYVFLFLLKQQKTKEGRVSSSWLRSTCRWREEEAGKPHAGLMLRTCSLPLPMPAACRIERRIFNCRHHGDSRVTGGKHGRPSPSSNLYRRPHASCSKGEGPINLTHPAHTDKTQENLSWRQKPESWTCHSRPREHRATGRHHHHLVSRGQPTGKPPRHLFFVHVLHGEGKRYLGHVSRLPRCTIQVWKNQNTVGFGLPDALSPNLFSNLTCCM